MNIDAISALKTKATDLCPCPFCSGPPVTIIFDMANGRSPLFLPDARLPAEWPDDSEGVWVRAHVFCHECGAESEHIDENLYSEQCVAEVVEKARKAWNERNERHSDLFEASKPVNAENWIDKYFI